ncbi:helix-turn-helix domain-containing protein [Shinella sp.]|uniref:helix-turn-helix domain-containing protein n=1 Tax=Shinella sp. TaxID=1870904 RepID=UPI0039E46AA0
MTRAPNSIDVQVGEKIRIRRRLLGFSQAELASTIGITFQQVQKYEKGTNRVSASRLQQIAELLKVPPSYFFPADTTSGTLGETPFDELARFVMAREGVELNMAFIRINSRTLRARIIRLVTAVAETGSRQDEAEE